MTAPSVKEEARRLVETLDDDSSWEDLAYLIHVRQVIARGLNESRDGLGISLSEVRRRYGVKE